GLIIASLAAAGIITMSLAYVLLGLAWVVAVGGSFFVAWSVQHKHRGIVAGFLAVMLIGVGWYETAHYEKAPAAKEIAEEIAKLIAGVPPVSLPLAHIPEIYSVPIKSTWGNMIFACLSPPPPDDFVAARRI